MVTGVSFRGGEATGSVADRKIESAKQETTGGVGARASQDSIFTVDNELKQDTVCFRGAEKSEEKKTSFAKVLFGTALTVAVVGGLLGLAKKYDVVSKIKHEKTKDILRYTDVVTEPCYKACKWIKNNSYDKIVAFINKKKYELQIKKSVGGFWFYQKPPRFYCFHRLTPFNH